MAGRATGGELTTSVSSLSEVWYRKLLGIAVVLGVGGGVVALGYGAFTQAGIDLFYGDPSSGVWSGRWWWIPLVSGGAVLVVILRRVWGVPEQVPGTIEFAGRAWVDPSSAISLVAISAISLFVGASLGPSFGIVVAGGGLGAWIVSRLGATDTEAKQHYTLTGMAGGLGAVFAAPLFASIMATELGPTRRANYVAAFFPLFIAATIGFLIFFGVTDSQLLDAFGIPGYQYESVHLLYGLALGAFSVLILLVYMVIGKAVERLAGLIKNPWVRAALAGAFIGLISFALPLTATGGSAQLVFETQNVAQLSVGLLVAVLLGKIVAVVLSQQAGFLGGTVFPILFIAGTAAVLVPSMFDDVPVSLAVATMLSAVPGAIIGAPVSFILIGVGAVGLGVTAIAPVGVAVVTSHLAMQTVKGFAETRKSM